MNCGLWKHDVLKRNCEMFKICSSSSSRRSPLWKKHGKLKFILLVSKLQQPVSGLRLARLLRCTTSEIVGGFILDVIFNLGKNSEGATCRVRLVFMTFHSTEPERSIWSMPDINSSSSLTNRTLLQTFKFLKKVQKCFAIITFLCDNDHSELQIFSALIRDEFSNKKEKFWYVHLPGTVWEQSVFNTGQKGSIWI